MRAIIIDDSKAMRVLLGRILADLGFDVTEAANGREGIERLRANGQTDLALVDWNMPEMSGVDFVRAVRSEPDYDPLRIIMVTTETEMSRVVKALGAGANEYIMKPFDKDAIREKLQLIGLVA